MSPSSKGSARERQVRKQLELEGWAVTRGSGSQGSADLWAAKMWLVTAGNDEGRWIVPKLRLIQVKTDAEKFGPYNNFGPKARQELLALAAQTGGTPELCWHPPNGEQRWIPASEWPK